MKKGKKMRQKFLIAIILMVIILGFALLSASLDITGIYGIKSVDWDVHFENAVVSEGSVAGTPSIIDDGTTISYSFKIDELEYFYEFTVDVVNGGSKDAIVGLVDNGLYNEDGTERVEVPDYLNYSITNMTLNDSLKVGQILPKNTTHKYKVRINIKDGYSYSELPDENNNYQFKLNVDYVQKKNGNEIDYQYYGTYASLNEVIPNLWTYEILDSNEKTASITGYNLNYVSESAKKAIINYCYENEDFCDISSGHKIKDLEKLVFPHSVLLDNEGNYSEDGEEYIITSVDISNGSNYHVNDGIKQLIFSNQITSVTLADEYKYLEVVKLPDSLTSLPYFNFIYDSNEEYHTPKEIRIPRGVTSLPSSSSYPNFNLDYNSHYCKNDGSSYKTYGVTDGGINLYIPKEVNSISSDSIQFSNFKKIYVESKGTKTKLLEAINDYCDERYSYFDYCYYSSDKCVRELNKRVVLDPLSF